ncbi:Putative methyl-accepting chemotaxis protein YoaH [Methanosarcinales archaeon]|nr:methyl-accepting chemotaxis protein [Candidatus Methanoperedens sp.]CAG1000761.1 Putative methyl-accepting chemotaxis protein YoaH [Methanosarcinales archaeon]
MQKRSGNKKKVKENIENNIKRSPNIRDSVTKHVKEEKTKISLLNNLHIPILSVDKDLNVRFINKAGAQAVGRAADACIGQKCFNIMKTDHCNTSNCQMIRAIKENGSFTSNTRAKLPAGDISIRYTASPLIDNTGNIVGGIESIIDTSEEEMAVAEIKRLVEAAIAGKLDTRGNPDNFKTPGFKSIVQGVNQTLDAVIGPLNVAAEYVDRISKGDIPEKIKDEYKGDFNEIKNNLNNCIDAIQNQANAARCIGLGDLSVKINVRSENDMLSRGLVNVISVLQDLQKELTRLTVASKEGQLSERGKPEQFKGAYADVVLNINNMLDAILLPIAEGNRVLHLIRGGNLRERVEINCKGDHAKMKDAVNGVHDWLNALIVYEKKIANGDLTATIEKASPEDQIHEWLMLLKTNIAALVTDADMLSKAAVEGKLDTRADASKHQGDFRKIVQGVDDTLDSVIGPLNVAAEYVDRISKGDIPEKIRDEYKGDFNEIKNNLNNCIDAVNLLVTDANMLAKAAVEGKLDTRADASKHQGDFRKIVQGVDDTLDSVIGPLNVAAEYVDRISKGDIPEKIKDEYKGDFNEIKNNLNTCIDAVNALVADANMLAKAAVEGKLDTRADASRHQGDFMKIVQGVNETLDAVIEPINDASRVVTAISEGDLTKPIEVSCQGDLKAFVDNIELMRHDLNSIIGKINSSANSVAISSQEMSEATKEMSSKAEQIMCGAKEMGSSSEQVAKTTQEIAHGSELQSEKIKGITNAMTDMTASVEAVTSNCQQAATDTKDLTDSAEKVGESTSQLVSKMSDIKGAVDESVNVIKNLDQKSNKIGEIVGLITNIADQTNLLALNAAIEAARAGEHGRGFAVVADEVRKLAEESRKAAGEISTLIHEVQEGTAKTVASMDIGAKQVADGSAALNKTASEIKGIVDKITNISAKVQEIASSAEAQSVGVEEVTSSVDDISKTVVESAASTEEASAATEQQLAAVEQQIKAIELQVEATGEMSNSAEQLSVLGEELKQIVGRFVLDNTIAQDPEGAGAGSIVKKQAKTPDKRELKPNLKSAPVKAEKIAASSVKETPVLKQKIPEKKEQSFSVKPGHAGESGKKIAPLSGKIAPE